MHRTAALASVFSAWQQLYLSQAPSILPTAVTLILTARPRVLVAEPCSSSAWPCAQPACFGLPASPSPSCVSLRLHILQLHQQLAKQGALHLLLQRAWAPYRALAPVYRNPLVTRRANATFVMLARNKDVAGVMQSIHQVEERFNRGFGYPWVLLNDQPFTDDFKRCVCAAGTGRGLGRN
jgi:hypothetical protein